MTGKLPQASRTGPNLPDSDPHRDKPVTTRSLESLIVDWSWSTY